MIFCSHKQTQISETQPFFFRGTPKKEWLSYVLHLLFELRQPFYRVSPIPQAAGILIKVKIDRQYIGPNLQVSENQCCRL